MMMWIWYITYAAIVNFGEKKSTHEFWQSEHPFRQVFAQLYEACGGE